MFRGGRKGLLCLSENIIDSALEGLNDTNHLDAYKCILARSAFYVSAAFKGLSAII